MAETIITRVSPATGTRGTRMRANSGRFTLQIPYDHAVDEVENHRQAAIQFAKHMDWNDHDFVSGSITMGMVHVPVGRYPAILAFQLKP